MDNLCKSVQSVVNKNLRKEVIMKDSTKRTLKRVVDIVIAVLTALITTLSAHAAIG